MRIPSTPKFDRRSNNLLCVRFYLSKIKAKFVDLNVVYCICVFLNRLLSVQCAVHVWRSFPIFMEWKSCIYCYHKTQNAHFLQIYHTPLTPNPTHKPQNGHYAQTQLAQLRWFPFPNTPHPYCHYPNCIHNISVWISCYNPTKTQASPSFILRLPTN